MSNGILMKIRQKQAETVNAELEKDFGCKYSADGVLQDVRMGGVFSVKPYNRVQDKAQYERIGKTVEKYVYGLLLDAGLEKLTIPIDAKNTDSKSFVFASPNLSTYKKLIILVQGSGAVEWASGVGDC